MTGSGEPGDPFDLTFNDAWAVEVAANMAESTAEVVVSSVNWNVSVFMQRHGPFGALSVSIQRLTSNIGATSGVIGTVEVAGRGTFASYTQALANRSSSQTTLRDTMCWYNAVTGEISVSFVETWNVGNTLLFNGVVYLGL